jgi:hypothetical protein
VPCKKCCANSTTSKLLPAPYHDRLLAVHSPFLQSTAATAEHAPATPQFATLQPAHAAGLLSGTLHPPEGGLGLAAGAGLGLGVGAGGAQGCQ